MTIEKMDQLNNSLTYAKTALLALKLALKERYHDNTLTEKEEFWELLENNVSYLDQHLIDIEVITK